MAGLLNIRDLDRLIDIERPVPDDAPDGAGSGTWETVEAGVFAQVQDALPGRGEQMADGIIVRTRPARVRMRYRDDVNGSMRFVMGDRLMAIVAGPAEIGRREGLEFMVADWTSAGNAA